MGNLKVTTRGGLQGHLTGALKFQVPSKGAVGGVSLGWLPNTFSGGLRRATLRTGFKVPAKSLRGCLKVIWGGLRGGLRSP